MKLLGNRGIRVNLNLSRQDRYDRIRPQGGRCDGALQPLRSEYRRNAREGNRRTCDVSERRSRARRPHSFLEGIAQSLRKARRVRGLSRKAKELLALLAIRPALLPLLFLGSVFFIGCGHKQAKVSLPPPPPPAPAQAQ